MEKQTLGQKIAELRKAKNLTQLELANRLSITDKAVSKWERDLSCPDISTVPKLAEILGVSADDLLRCSKNEKTEIEKNDIPDTVLKAVPLALGVAATVLTAMKAIAPLEALSLLGIAVTALAIRNFREK